MARRPVARYCAPPVAFGEVPAMSKVERVSSADLAELEWESPEAPMHIAAIIELETEIDYAELCFVLAGRIRGVPRLRERLVMPPHRTRQAAWAEDPEFAVERHVSVKSCPPPGDA